VRGLPCRTDVSMGCNFAIAGQSSGRTHRVAVELAEIHDCDCSVVCEEARIPRMLAGRGLKKKSVVWAAVGFVAS
jgi:hypothetical protein